MKNSIYEYTLEQLQIWLTEHNLKPFIAKQIFEWIYKKRVKSFEEMSNISKVAKQVLNENFFFPSLKIKNKLVTKNHATIKFLFELEDGNLIETVIMHHNYGYSACLTTQVGCNMGCAFCASGQLKKVRNLSVSEIVLQLVSCDDFLWELNQNLITRIVIMGIGEPFDNYDNLLNSMKIINNPFGIGLGSRKITISSCGLMDKMVKFAHEMPQVNLAISLHAPNDAIRNKIMPISRRYKYEQVINGIDELIKITNRKITIEYILIKDLNDKYENALELSNVLKDKLVYINLIPYNPVLVNPMHFERTKRAKEFQKELTDLGVQCTLRQEFGTEIDAACGQLRAVNLTKNTNNL